MRCLSLLALLGLPTLAVAVDVDPFEPAGSLAHGNGAISTESATLAGEGIAFGILGGMADDLMVLRFAASGDEQPFLSNAFHTTAYVGYTYKDKFRVELFAPLYLSVYAPGVNFRGLAMGDSVLQGNIPLWQPSDAFNLSVLPGFGVPTGSKNALLARGTSGRLKVAMSGSFDFGLGYATNLGVVVSPKNALRGVDFGSTFEWQTAAWFAPADQFRIGLEYDAHLSMVGNNHVAEARVFAQGISPDGISMTLGVGRGLIAGVGAPDYRVFGGITYGPTARDRDKDGILDRDDACPTDPEDIDTFEDADGCPDPDNDQDTLLDTVDACPLDAEDFDEFEDDNGCPDPDNDQDGTLDADDRCPIDAGPEMHKGCPDTDEDGLADLDDQCPEQSGAQAFSGCPDGDADNVPDYRDVCPTEKAPADEELSTSDGCPKEVYVSQDQIRFTQKILFQTNRAVIKSQSFGILDAIASIMKDNAHVRRVEVAGHTDNEGSDTSNMKLSKRRAAAVREYLVKKGIDANRLSSQGYGETQPRDSNRTTFGRANNRRVEFRILEQEQRKTTERSIAADAEYSLLNVLTPDAVSGWTPIYVDGELLPHRAPIERLLIAPGRHTIEIRGEGFGWTEQIESRLGQMATILIPDSALNSTQVDNVETPILSPTNDGEVIEQPLAIPIDEPVEDIAPAPEPEPVTEPAPEPEALPAALSEPTPETVPDTSTPAEPESSGTNATTGQLSIFLEGQGEAVIFVDGTEIEQRAPVTGYSLDVGPHAIRVVNEARGLNTLQVVRIEPGEEVSMSLKLEGEPEPSAAPAPADNDAAPDSKDAPKGKKSKKGKKGKKGKKDKKNEEEAATPPLPMPEPEPEPVPEAEPEAAQPSSDDPWGTEPTQAPEPTDDNSSDDDDPWAPNAP